MRNQVCNIICGKVVALHHLFGYVCHIYYSILENALPFLVDEVHTLVHIVVACRIEASAGCLVQISSADAVYVEDGILESQARCSPA